MARVVTRLPRLHVEAPAGETAWVLLLECGHELYVNIPRGKGHKVPAAQCLRCQRTEEERSS